MDFRIEKDTIGEVKVPNDKYWGAQTERSHENFLVGEEVMPKEIIKAFSSLKKACAIVNFKLGKLPEDRKNAIVKACEDIHEGKLEGNFPLVVWQTGSGTQSNMNMNEVIANYGTELMGQDFRVNRLIHPNDDVNKGQSSNDTFPTAMRVAFVMELQKAFFPSLQILRDGLQKKVDEFKDIVKCGRTHLQDAVPLTLGQEFSGYVEMIDKAKEQVEDSMKYICELAIGGTAVGTGLNCHPKFGEMVCDELDLMTKTKYKFISGKNKFHGLTAHDGEVFLSGALSGLAANLMKIANDIRWLGSGPRCGIGELNLPANEPGSSIMPGKVNPTQCESVTMVSVQVMANHTAITMGASQGNFELNVFKPVIAYNLLNSIRLLSDTMKNFTLKCISGIEANRKNIDKYLNKSLMLVTALNPYIGYENAAKIAKTAHKNGTTLKEEAVNLGLLSAEDFDKYIVPKEMTHPKS